MEEKEIKKTIYICKNTIYKNFLNKNILEKSLYRLYKLQEQDEDNYKVDELIAHSLYLLGRYDESLCIYNKLVKIKPISKYYFAIYKNYVAKEDLENINNSYRMYKTALQEKIQLYDSTLVDSILDYIDNATDFNIKYHTRYAFLDLTTNDELLNTYNKLIDSINNNDFSKAIDLCDNLDNIARENNINTEFYSLKKLLNICLKTHKSRINKNININTIYKNLRTAIQNNDVNTIISILNSIKNCIVTDKNLIINSLYLLIQNNHLEEAINLMTEFDFLKKNKEQLKILKTAINEVNHINNLNNDQLEVYNIAISKGSYYYHEYDLENTYDYYTLGLYVTEAPIFYYYIGKIYYKCNMYKDAMYYFEQYIKLGTTKINKAYLYLSKISEKFKKEKKSVNYSKYVQMTNDLLSSEYDFYSIYEQECDPYKVNMQRILNLDESFFTK